MGRGQRRASGALLPLRRVLRSGRGRAGAPGASAGLLRDGSADAAHVIAPARKQPHVARLCPGTPPPLGRSRPASLGAGSFPSPC